ncbi:hypothetical protein BKA56DRAFT_499075 [Ilyonectria sp. MPI-CAGE-AT-0026]|nr:hypothetical protein BKA56DRAFT_499075 [Ilyonectria sp. MPI-CAGE-AT-0026]
MDKKVLARCPLPRHEILHYLRTEIESTQRADEWNSAGFRMYEPCTRLLQDPQAEDTCHNGRWCCNRISEMHLGTANRLCNKMVPLYLVDLPGALLSPPMVLRAALNRWLYRTWFQPCKSEVEYGRFIASVMTPTHIPQDIDFRGLVKDLTSLSAALCAQIEQVHQKKKGFKQAQKRYGPETFDEAKDENQDNYIIQPLFRAMAIVLLTGNFNMEVSDMGQVPVLVVLTGVEDGLSAPISFEQIAHKAEAYISNSAIQVSLETAVSFVMDLENREIAAFGRRPDPVESTSGNQAFACHMRFAFPRLLSMLGWGDEPLNGHSSSWVDLEKHPEWAVDSASYDTDLDYTYR